MGDSITHFWLTYGIATWDADFAPLGAEADGFPGATTSEVIAHLEAQNLAAIHPRLAVLLVGTNNVASGEAPAQIVSGILAVVHVVQERVSPVRFLLLAPLPRDQPESTQRQGVVAVDRLLRASVPHGIGYLDLGQTLLEPDDSFVPGVMHPDLLHPTAAGYARIAAALAPVVRQMLAGAEA